MLSNRVTYAFKRSQKARGRVRTRYSGTEFPGHTRPTTSAYLGVVRSLESLSSRALASSQAVAGTAKEHTGGWYVCPREREFSREQRCFYCSVYDDRSIKRH